MRGESPDAPTGGSRRKRRARGASYVEPGPFFQMGLNVLDEVEAQLRSASKSDHVFHALLRVLNRGRAALAELASRSASVPADALALAPSAALETYRVAPAPDGACAVAPAEEQTHGAR